MSHSRDLISSFDLEAYLQRFCPIPTQTNEWVLQCPTCGKEKMVVNTVKKSWHCWVCEEYHFSGGKRIPVRGAGGLIDLIQLLEGCTRERAISILADSAQYQSVPIDQLSQQLLVEQPVDVADFPEIPPPDCWQPIANYNALPYLQYRGISEEDVRAFGLVHCASGRYANRLIFPVWERNRLVYFQARAMWESDDPRFRKSMNPEKQLGFAGATDVLMNLDVARHYPRVALVEGPIDNTHVGPSCVTTFGKKISLVQIYKLWRAGVRALDLMWDGPTPKEPMGAWPEMIKAAPLLSGMFDTRLVFIPYGDPGLYHRRDCDVMRAQGRPASTVSALSAVSVL